MRGTCDCGDTFYRDEHVPEDHDPLSGEEKRLIAEWVERRRKDKT